MSMLYPRKMFLLDEACKPIWKAFGEPPYLVGTTCTHKASAMSDVDVRLILDDAKFDALRTAIGDSAVIFLGLAVAEYLHSRTDLPVDFQFQRMTEANAKYGKKPRNPLGVRELAEYEGDAAIENPISNYKKVRCGSKGKLRCEVCGSKMPHLPLGMNSCEWAMRPAPSRKE